MSRKLRVVREEEGETFFQPGSVAKMLISPKLTGSKGMDLGILRLDSQKETKPNVHPVSEELFYILKGKGKIIVEDEMGEISAGMSIYIPPNVSHVFVNTGEEPLEFILMHSPPEREEDARNSPWNSKEEGE